MGLRGKVVAEGRRAGVAPPITPRSQEHFGLCGAKPKAKTLGLRHLPPDMRLLDFPPFPAGAGAISEVSWFRFEHLCLITGGRETRRDVTRDTPAIILARPPQKL